MSKLLSMPEIIARAQKLRASDIHIVCGIPIRLRIDGKLQNLDDNVMTPGDCESYARDLTNHYDAIAEIGEQDLAIGFPDGTRCRVNLFRQQGYVSAAIRILNNHIPAFAAASAVRAAELNKFFAAEGHTAVAALTGGDVNFDMV